MSTIFLILYVMSVVSAIGLGLYSALSDVRGMKIPNGCSLFIAVAFIVAYAASMGAGADVFQNWKSHVVAAVIMLVVTILMYAAKALGAGDSKLGTAFALWAGLKGLYSFIFVMALVGGLVALAALLMSGRKMFPNAREGSWVARVQAGERVVPYGVAICAGACFAFFNQGLLSPDTFQAFFSPQS